MLPRAETPIHLDAYFVTLDSLSRTLAFADPQGQPIGDAYARKTLATTDRAANTRMYDFARMYAQSGPGKHPAGPIMEELGMSASAFAKLVDALRFCTPPEVFTSEPATIIALPTALHFGNIALATKLPTAEEKEAYAARQKTLNAAAERRKQAIIEADPLKTDTTLMDHAFIEANGRRYYLPLGSRTTILAARMAEALAGYDTEKLRQEGINSKDISRTIWAALPIAERQLYASEGSQVYSSTSAAP